MEIKALDKEFVQRTKAVIEELYETGCTYEVTLLINCMLALVALPIERSSNSSRNKDFRSAIKEKLRELKVVEKSNDDTKLFRSIKNALSHMHIEIKNSNGKINEVWFWDVDFDKKRPHTIKQAHTVLRFSISQLKEFAIFVANKHLDRLSP